MQIIDGKKVSAQVKEEVKRQTLELKETHKITPGLAVVIVGDDPASRVYVNNKKKACEFVGFKSEEYALPAETTQEELLNLVETLNNKKDINGILVQLPLPKHLDDKAVIEAISPLKVGRPKFVTADMVKEGAVVIDVGMDRDENGKLCGDVDFENVKDKCSFITPVPGGVGPMTISTLMKNTLKACKIQNNI